MKFLSFMLILLFISGSAIFLKIKIKSTKFRKKKFEKWQWSKSEKRRLRWGEGITDTDDRKLQQWTIKYF